MAQQYGPPVPPGVGGDSSKGALGATASGAATGAMLGGPWGAAIGGGIGALGSIFGGGSSGLTEEERTAALGELDRYYKQAYGEYNKPINVGTSTYSPGSTKQQNLASALKPQMFSYFKSLGLSDAEAQRRTKKQSAKVTKGGFNIDKLGTKAGGKKGGFSTYLQGQDLTGTGLDYDPNTGTFSSKATDPSLIGGRQESDVMQAKMTEDIFKSAEGLPEKFRKQADEGLDFQSQIRQNLASQFGANANDMQNYLNADVQKIMDISKGNMQRSYGELMDSGFASSSLARQSLENNVYSPERRLYGELQGNLAGLRQGQIGSMLGASQALGGPDSFGQYMGGSFTAPGSYGGVSDEFGIGAIMGRQGQMSELKRQQGNARAGIQAQPTGGGFF